MLKKALGFIYTAINCIISVALIFLGLMETALGCPNIKPLAVVAILIIALIMSINSYALCAAMFDGNKKGH